MCGILFLDQDVYQTHIDYISKHLETQKNHLCPLVFVLFLTTLITWCTYCIIKFYYRYNHETWARINFWHCQFVSNST